MKLFLITLVALAGVASASIQCTVCETGVRDIEQYVDKEEGEFKSYLDGECTKLSGSNKFEKLLCDEAVNVIVPLIYKEINSKTFDPQNFCTSIVHLCSSGIDAELFAQADNVRGQACAEANKIINAIESGLKTADQVCASEPNTFLGELVCKMLHNVPENQIKTVLTTVKAIVGSFCANTDEFLMHFNCADIKKADALLKKGVAYAKDYCRSASPKAGIMKTFCGMVQANQLATAEKLLDGAINMICHSSSVGRLRIVSSVQDMTGRLRVEGVQDMTGRLRVEGVQHEGIQHEGIQHEGVQDMTGRLRVEGIQHEGIQHEGVQHEGVQDMTGRLRVEGVSAAQQSACDEIFSVLNQYGSSNSVLMLCGMLGGSKSLCETIASGVSDVVQGADTLCPLIWSIPNDEMCHYINVAQGFVDGNQFDGICSALASGHADLCNTVKGLFNDYASAAKEQFNCASQLDVLAESSCKQLGSVCCGLCETFIEMVAVIPSNKNMDVVKAQADKVCDFLGKLNKAIDTACKGWVDQYITEIFQAAQGLLQPKAACIKMHACSS